MWKLRLLSRTTIQTIRLSPTGATPIIQAAPISKSSGIRKTNYGRNLYRNAAVFIEIAQAIDVAPDVQGEITGGGIRYWF
jgi:hypothetical protein